MEKRLEVSKEHETTPKKEIATDHREEIPPSTYDDYYSQFELPPSEHPAHGGGGYYYEFQNGPDNTHTGIGYEFSSMSQQLQEDTTRSLDHEETQYYDECSNDDEQYEDANDAESGHGDDVGQEEDDPG